MPPAFEPRDPDFAPRVRASTGTKCCMAAVINVITPTARATCAHMAGDAANICGKDWLARKTSSEAAINTINMGVIVHPTSQWLR
jgi:hypothetical protein